MLSEFDVIKWHKVLFWLYIHIIKAIYNNPIKPINVLFHFKNTYCKLRKKDLIRLLWVIDSLLIFKNRSIKEMSIYFISCTISILLYFSKLIFRYAAVLLFLNDFFIQPALLRIIILIHLHKFKYHSSLLTGKRFI